MIAKGNLHAHGAKLAAYLTTGKDGERAELAELRGFVATNIRDAFLDVQIQAEGTRCEKPFFHAYVRLPADETLTPAQWQMAADRIERRLGFTDQPREIAFHYKSDGETHMHVAWSRIDLDTMKAIDPGLYKNKLKELCREMERDFGLTLVKSDRDPDQKTRSAGRAEFEQSRRLNTDLTAIRETIRDCWDRSDNGSSFRVALDQQGLILARGDRRDFVIVDRDGGDHALGKRITGATMTETRARMTDIDREQLPGVEQAKAMQLERPREPEPHAPEPRAQEIPAAPTQQPEPEPKPEMARAAARAPDHDVGVDLSGAGAAVTGGLMVAADVIGKPAEKLTDFIAGFFESFAGGAPTPPRKISADDYLDNPAARLDHAAQRKAERASEEAILRIRDHIESGKSLQPEDIRTLTPDHLLNLRAKGDAYMQQMIYYRDRDEERSRER